jgi:hypothetical protein
MYTQWEHGRTYLYIERAQQSLTTVDISRKKNLQIVNHAPAQVASAQYEPLFEGGTIEVSPTPEVVSGVDNRGGGGLRSTLENSDPGDARLLRALGPSYSNLADREHRLVFFSSPSQLLVVQDNRIAASDLMTN